MYFNFRYLWRIYYYLNHLYHEKIINSSDGKDSNKWKMTGDVSVQDDIMTLKGTDALAVLKNGKYKNFDLTLDLRTTPGGKGAVWFHTDPTLKKGYRIAINNDRADKVWWKMTGSRTRD